MLEKSTVLSGRRDARPLRQAGRLTPQEQEHDAPAGAFFHKKGLAMRVKQRRTKRVG
jgi:hypothetical protein